MRNSTTVPADEVIEYLKEQGATRTDYSKKFPDEGRRKGLISEYVRLMEEGAWWESDRPIHLDARSGMVWQGTDRCAAINQVDWEKVKSRNLPVPRFTIEVQKRES